MITLDLSIIVLLLGYFVYSKYIERVFGADRTRATPAITMADGMDYRLILCWRIFLIKFLNYAGKGPILGVVAVVMWGLIAYLWIILGSVGLFFMQINFDVICHYFAYSNQLLLTVVLWTITVCLVGKKNNFWFPFIPALFMTVDVLIYLFLAPDGFHLSKTISYSGGIGITIFSALIFETYYKKQKNQ